MADHSLYSLQRAKLPKWIGQYIKEPDTNLSTDMAINQSKKFLRTMAQPFEQSSKSLWGIDQVLQRQRGLRGEEEEQEEDGDDEAAMFDEIPDEALMDGLTDSALMEVDVEIGMMGVPH